MIRLPGFTGQQGSLADDFLQRLDTAFFETFGATIVRMNTVPDPLTMTGFLQWEGSLIHDLRAATAESRDTALGEIALLIETTEQRKDKSAYTDALMLGLAAVLALLAQGSWISVQPIGSEHSRGIAQATIDSWGKAQVGPGGNLRDHEKRMLQALADRQGFFVNRFFGPIMLGRAQELTVAAFERHGDRPADVAEHLLASLQKMVRQTENYWDLYATTVLNQARSYASLEQFASGGVRSFVYYNPLDEHTTSFCRNIAGVEMRVSDARAHMERIADAQSVEQLEEIAPFVRNKAGEPDVYIVRSGGEDVEFSGESITAQSLANYGFLTPPFHPRCRTLILPV